MSQKSILEQIDAPISSAQPLKSESEETSTAVTSPHPEKMSAQLKAHVISDPVPDFDVLQYASTRVLPEPYALNNIEALLDGGDYLSQQLATSEEAAPYTLTNGPHPANSQMDSGSDLKSNPLEIVNSSLQLDEDGQALSSTQSEHYVDGNTDTVQTSASFASNQTSPILSVSHSLQGMSLPGYAVSEVMSNEVMAQLQTQAQAQAQARASAELAEESSAAILDASALASVLDAPSAGTAQAQNTENVASAANVAAATADAAAANTFAFNTTGDVENSLHVLNIPVSRTEFGGTAHNSHSIDAHSARSNPDQHFYAEDKSRTLPEGHTVAVPNQAAAGAGASAGVGSASGTANAQSAAQTTAAHDRHEQTHSSTLPPRTVFKFIDKMAGAHQDDDLDGDDPQTSKITNLLNDYLLAPRYEALTQRIGELSITSFDDKATSSSKHGSKLRAKISAELEDLDFEHIEPPVFRNEEDADAIPVSGPDSTESSISAIYSAALTSPEDLDAAADSTDPAHHAGTSAADHKTDKSVASLAYYLLRSHELSFTHELPLEAFAHLTQARVQNAGHSELLANDAAELVIPHQQNANFYKQVSTDGSVEHFDPDVLLRQDPDSDQQKLFDSMALPESSLNQSYSEDKLNKLGQVSAIFNNIDNPIAPTKVQKGELLASALKDFGPNLSFFKRRNRDNPTHAVISDIPKFWFTEEINETLNYVIQHHEKYHFSDTNKELLSCVGNWCYDRDEGGFFIDDSCAYLLGVENDHKVLTHADLNKIFEPQDVDKIAYNFTRTEAGMVFTDRLKLRNGPYKGLTIVAQGSATLRDDTGSVLIASGFLCYEFSPQADFLFREIVGDGTFVWNAENDRTQSSSAYHAMLGYNQEEFPNTFTEFCQKLVHPDDDESLVIQKHIVRNPNYGDSFEACLRLKHKDGNYIWTIGRGLVLERNAKGVATKLIGSQTNINLVHKSFENIGSLMFTDSLTELYNRSYFKQNAVRYEQAKNQPMSVIFVDVTGLKLTNDILGHNYGDFLIIKCVVCMMRALQKILGRFKMFDNYQRNLDESINNLTLKAFELIFQNKDMVLGKIPKNINEPHTDKNLHKFLKNISLPNAASFADTHKDIDPSLNLQKESIETLLKLKVNPEMIRLAGDEVLLLFPNCSFELILQLKKEICDTLNRMNAVDRINFPWEQRPVPLCFGIGCATVGEEGEQDSFKMALERADMRMLENKEKHQADNHKLLKEYFERRLQREVSMRDSRREEVLTEQERQELRQQIMEQRGQSVIKAKDAATAVNASYDEMFE